jgi:hypothetical protein
LLPGAAGWFLLAGSRLADVLNGFDAEDHDIVSWVERLITSDRDPDQTQLIHLSDHGH